MNYPRTHNWNDPDYDPMPDDMFVDGDEWNNLTVELAWVTEERDQLRAIIQRINEVLRDEPLESLRLRITNIVELADS